MTTASLSGMPTQTAAFIEIQAENQRVSAEELLSAMQAIEQQNVSIAELSRQPVQRSSPSSSAPRRQRPTRDLEPALNGQVSSDDPSQTFCQWLAAVRELQKDPWERKRTVLSFAMLVFHSGIDESDSASTDSLSREQLEMIGKAPGWNENEHKIIDVLKSHFYTIKELSASRKSGICYADLQNLYSGKKKLRDNQRVAASTESAKSGFGAGLTVQLLFLLVALQAGLTISIVLAALGALVGLVTQQSIEGAYKTALAGAFWGISAGSGVGAAMGARRADEYFDRNLSPRIEELRHDLKSLSFE